MIKHALNKSVGNLHSIKKANKGQKADGDFGVERFKNKRT